METRNLDACQTVAADSTTAAAAAGTTATTTTTHNANYVVDVAEPASASTSTPISRGNVQHADADTSTPPQQQQVSSSTSACASKKNSSPPGNNNNNNNNNKVKAQQYHQFRAPQQFVRQLRAPATTGTGGNKKNKTWNKRQQQKTAKQQQQQQQQQLLQQQQQQLQQYAQQTGAQALGVDGQTAERAASAVGASGGSGGGAVGTPKADLENIQNFKNQLGSGHHYYQHHGGGGGHRGGVAIAGNGLPPSALSGLEKLGYGHGQLKLYKKMLAYRGGHHHHVLCAGAAHNTLGGMAGIGAAGGNGNGGGGGGPAANVHCCLLNGCGGAAQNGKDAASGGGGGGSIGNNNITANATAALHYCCGRSKFFLPDKRLRKEIIIPPTKFLLGGNISDPLNLNSLQNENSNASSNNNTPATTPRQSPITTPPKVEVIIPPNIHDPLHLLDPVDSMEYEKQLTSPMKRGPPRGGHGAHHHSAKHRHRKNRKTKRRRYDSYNTSAELSAGDGDERSGLSASLVNSTMTTDTSLASATTSLLLDNSASNNNINNSSVVNSSNNNLLNSSSSSTCESSGVLAVDIMSSSVASSNNSGALDELVRRTQSSIGGSPPIAAADSYEERLARNSVSPVKHCATQLGERTGALPNALSAGVELSAPCARDDGASGSGVGGDAGTGAGIALPAATHVASCVEVAPLLLKRERANRDLRLDLSSTYSSGSTCGSVIGAGIGASSGGGVGAAIMSAGVISLVGNSGGGARKRKISESNNSQKNKKFHRHDAMDKIVSPVVPQPGAWKRPPRLAASGARKPSRRSTSISETDVLSPADEMARSLLTEATGELLRVETPDFSKLETISEAGLGSPLSTTSGATSVAAGEQESSLIDTSAGENSTSMTTIEECQGVSAAATVNTSVGSIVTVAATAAIAQLTRLPRFRADGVKYRYGNYDRYVGFRHLNEFMDVRLQVFRRHSELFQNKDILDIGCNAGHMTIAVARSFAPKSILGIDIDKELVTRARRNLALHVRIPAESVAPKSSAPACTTATAAAVMKKEEQPTSADSAPTAAVSVAADVVKTEASTAIETATANINAVAGSSCASAATAAQSSKKTRRRKKTKSMTVLPLQRQQQQQQQLNQHHHLHHHHMHHHHHHHYQHHQHQLQLQKLHVPAIELFPVSFPLSYGGVLGPAAPSIAVADGHSPSGSTSTPGHASTATAAANVRKPLNDFPRNVYFRQCNYVLKDESQLSNDCQQYDLILCLSVTKWIHLNFGDAGLKLAFKRMFNQLRPGGKLILEAQNWASYKKKKNLTPEIYHNYRNIEFFPNKFHEYLLSSDVGFSHSYTLGVPKHLNKGFCRPLQLYAKGDYTPNHVRWSDAYYPQTPYEAYRGIYATMPPRPAGMVSYAMSSTRSQAYDTPHYTGGASGPYSCRQTPMYQPIYNPLETDSYLPSYDMEYLNHMYVFASPLYQTIWSPPASLRNSSSHTPIFGSVRDAELDGDGSGGGGGGSYHRHVYPPNDDTSSPNANAGGAFSSIRDPDTDDSNQLPAGRSQHVYATNCGESSSSPQVHHHDSETIDEGLMLADDEHAVAAVSGSSAQATTGGSSSGNATQHHYCDLSDA